MEMTDLTTHLVNTAAESMARLTNAVASHAAHTDERAVAAATSAISYLSTEGAGHLTRVATQTQAVSSHMASQVPAALATHA